MTQPQLVVIIVHSQHPDYQAPNCDPQCIKDDTLAHLEKVPNYQIVHGVILHISVTGTSR